MVIDRAAVKLSAIREKLGQLRVAPSKSLGQNFLHDQNLARWLVAQIPERVIGPVFNKLRLSWKALSKPTKRKGLAGLTMIETQGAPGHD